MQNEIKDKTFKLFRSMKPGQVIIIREFAKKDPKGFIQYGKDFIDEGNHNYEFTKEYKSFRRMYHKIDFSQYEQYPL